MVLLFIHTETVGVFFNCVLYYSKILFEGARKYCVSYWHLFTFGGHVFLYVGSMLGTL